MKKTLLFSLLLSLFINANAQDLTKYFPENPLVYGRLDLPVLFKNQPLDSLKKKEFFQDFLQKVNVLHHQNSDSLLTSIMNNIEKFGLALNKNAYFIVNQEDSLVQSNLIFQIGNSEELEKNINMLFPVGDSTVYYSAAKDFKLFIYQDLHMAWNNEVLWWAAEYLSTAKTTIHGMLLKRNKPVKKKC